MVTGLQLDVILVDLDGGDIKTPECVTVPLISEPMLARTKKSLNMVSTAFFATLPFPCFCFPLCYINNNNNFIILFFILIIISSLVPINSFFPFEEYSY